MLAHSLYARQVIGWNLRKIKWVVVALLGAYTPWRLRQRIRNFDVWAGKNPPPSALWKTRLALNRTVVYTISLVPHHSAFVSSHQIAKTFGIVRELPQHIDEFSSVQ